MANPLDILDDRMIEQSLAGRFEIGISFIDWPVMNGSIITPTH
jgi:hypothetical protein